MFILDPGSWFLPIPDPGSWISDPGSKNSNKREGWKKICCHNFLCSHKFHKIANYFSFEVLRKKIWANFERIIEFFTQKIVNKLSKIWVWDPGSEIRDPGSGKNLFRIPGSKRHRIPDPDPQHWFFFDFKFFPPIFGHQKPKFGLVFSLKCWILIRTVKTSNFVMLLRENIFFSKLS